MSRYTVARELLVGGWLWQVVDVRTGWRSIPCVRSAALRLADRLNAAPEAEAVAARAPLTQ